MKKKDLKIAGGLNHPINYDAHRQKTKGSKIYNKGKSTTNEHEKEMFLKRTGPRLPLAKRKTNNKQA
mgnify:CR=1 FL=1